MCWMPGRQGGGYQKFPILSAWFFDLYLIRYREGAGVKWHFDPVKGKKHYRLNILLKRPKQGGEFNLKGPSIFAWWRFRIFRPDLYAHCVLPVVEGERLVLSLGWVRK